MVSAKLKRHNSYLNNDALVTVSTVKEEEQQRKLIEPKASEQLTKQLWNFLTQSNNILTENIENYVEEQNDTQNKWSVVNESSSLPNSILLTNDNTMTLHNPIPKRRHHFHNNNNNNGKLLKNKIMDNSNNNYNMTNMSTIVSNMTDSSSAQLLMTEATHPTIRRTAASVYTTAATTTATTTTTTIATLATDNAAFSIFPATNASLILNENVSSALWNFENIEEDDFDFFYRHSFWMSTLLIFAYIVVFVVGLVGNSFVIAVVLRAPRMRTVTNYFIVNLAVADILVIIFCLPATLMSNIFLPWLLGWLMCKTVPYIQGVSVAASVYSLIAVSLDRFIAIWWPLKQMTKSRARFMILCIWIIALGSTIPWVLFFDLVPASEAFPGAEDMYFCQEVWPPGTNGNLYFLVAHLIACYLLPMSLITLCYVLIWIKVSTRSIPGDSKDAQMDRMQQKSKVKVIKMLVAVVILFVLSWLPLYVIFARIKFGGEISLEESEILNTITPFAQWLGSSNSCINPILYAFFNNKYRRGFAAIIKSRSCCGRLRYYDNVAIASSTTSTRKSSHNSRKGPSSPGLRKNNAVSYIYEHNSLRRNASHHTMMAKQDSNLSQRMLLKQDSHGSRQLLIKQESASSDGSRRPLCQQESNGSKMSLSKQDSIVSYIEPKRAGQEVFFSQDHQHENIPPYHERPKFVKQDSIMSTESRRYPFIKQDSVISFADQRRGPLNKQDSIVACSNRSGDNVAHTHHVSILKKTDSMLSGGSTYSPSRRNIEIQEQQITYT